MMMAIQHRISRCRIDTILASRELIRPRCVLPMWRNVGLLEFLALVHLMQATLPPVNFLPQTCDSSETRSHRLSCRILDAPPPMMPAPSGNLLLLPTTQPPPPLLGSQMHPLKLMGRPHSASRVELPMPGSSYSRPPTTPRRALQTSP